MDALTAQLNEAGIGMSDLDNALKLVFFDERVRLSAIRNALSRPMSTEELRGVFSRVRGLYGSADPEDLYTAFLLISGLVQFQDPRLLPGDTLELVFRFLFRTGTVISALDLMNSLVKRHGKSQHTALRDAIVATGGVADGHCIGMIKRQIDAAFVGEDYEAKEGWAALIGSASSAELIPLLRHWGFPVHEAEMAVYQGPVTRSQTRAAAQ